MKPDPNPAYRRFRDYRPPSTVDRIVAFAAVSLILAALLLAARAAFAMPFAMRLAFWGQSASASSKLANLAYPENYVQDGLVCMYDGRWNAGWGRHDSTATTWKNIGSGGSAYDAVLAPQKASGTPQWGDDYVHLAANSPCFYINYAKFLQTVIPTNWTVECVVKDDAERYDRSAGIVGALSADMNDGDWVGLSFGKYEKAESLVFRIGSDYDNSGLYATLQTKDSSDSEYETVAYSMSCAGLPYADSDGLNTPLLNRTLCVYQNGEIYRTVPSTTSFQILYPLNDPDYFCIGNARSISTTSRYNYVGRIYSVRIYNRALTDAEVARNYVVDAARFGLPYTDPDEETTDPDPTPSPETMTEAEAYAYYAPDTAIIVDLALMGSKSVSLNLQNVAATSKVDWGDGATATVSSSSTAVTHSYAEDGRYVIRIGGDVASPWQMSSKPALLNGLVRVLRWGDNVVSGDNNVQCRNAANLRGPMPRWSAAMRNVNFFYSGCVNLDGDIQPWSDDITTLIYAFENCAKIGGEVPAWPSKVDNLGGVFYGCKSLTGAPPQMPAKINYANDTYVGCTGLTGTIPEFLGSGPFTLGSYLAGCTGLTGKIPKWGSRCSYVNSCYENCTGLTGAWTTDAAELMPSRISSHQKCVLGASELLRNLFKKSWGGSLDD